MKKFLAFSFLLTGFAFTGEFKPVCSSNRFDAIIKHVKDADKALRYLKEDMDSEKYRNVVGKTCPQEYRLSEFVNEKLKLVENCLYVPNLTNPQRQELIEKVDTLKSNYNLLTNRSNFNTFSFIHNHLAFFINPWFGSVVFTYKNILKPYFAKSTNDTIYKYYMPKFDSKMQKIASRSEELIQINRQ